MMTWDPGLFYDQMAAAAYAPWLFALYFWTFFLLIAVLVINILVCIFIDAYCIVVADARAAPAVWTELYHHIKHDVSALLLPRTKFMTDARVLDLLTSGFPQCPPPGYPAMRKLVMEQLDHHRGRAIETADEDVTLSPWDLLELVRGQDAAHNHAEVRKLRSALDFERSFRHLDADDAAAHAQFVGSGAVAGGDGQLQMQSCADLGRLILMNHISEKDVSEDLVELGMAEVFADKSEQHMLDDLMLRLASVECVGDEWMETWDGGGEGGERASEREREGARERERERERERFTGIHTHLQVREHGA